MPGIPAFKIRKCLKNRNKSTLSKFVAVAEEKDLNVYYNKDLSTHTTIKVVVDVRGNFAIIICLVWGRYIKIKR